MITAGINCGAKNTKTVIVKDSKIIGKDAVPTQFDLRKASEDSFLKAVQAAGISQDDIENTLGVNEDFVLMGGIALNPGLATFIK